eukprot:g21060.t1
MAVSALVPKGLHITLHKLGVCALFPVSGMFTLRLCAPWEGVLCLLVSSLMLCVIPPVAGAHIPFPKDCGEEHSNGRTESSIVTLYLNGDKDKPIKAYCDMETDGGGWL